MMIKITRLGYGSMALRGEFNFLSAVFERETQEVAAAAVRRDHG